MYSVRWTRSITRARSRKTGGRLITAGPYRFSRNPIYIGNGLIGLGLTWLSGITWALPVFVILFLIQYIPIVRFEEAVLEEKFGDEFRQYKKQAPRWIGIIRLEGNNGDSEGEVYQLKKILKSEIYTFASILTIGTLMTLHHFF